MRADSPIRGCMILAIYPPTIKNLYAVVRSGFPKSRVPDWSVRQARHLRFDQLMTFTGFYSSVQNLPPCCALLHTPTYPASQDQRYPLWSKGPGELTNRASVGHDGHLRHLTERLSLIRKASS